MVFRKLRELANVSREHYLSSIGPEQLLGKILLLFKKRLSMPGKCDKKIFELKPEFLFNRFVEDKRYKGRDFLKVFPF